MTPPDPLIGALHRAAVAVCPRLVRERVVDQALADLAEERHAATSALAVWWVTVRGVLLLAVALVWSLWALRVAWDTRVGVVRAATGWFVLMTLLVTLRFSTDVFEPLRLLDPPFVLRYLAPIAVPAAALGLALSLTHPGWRSVIVLACAAATFSLALTTGPRALEEINQSRLSSGPRAVEHPGPPGVGPAAWSYIRQKQREQWLQEITGPNLQIALLSLLLPVAGSLVVRTLRVSPTQVVALLVSIGALQALWLWIRLRAVDPASAWKPHLVLVVGIVVMAMALRFRGDGRSADAA